MKELHRVYMLLKYFLVALYRQCFTCQRSKEAFLRRENYKKRLKRYEKLLDKQDAAGFQRHFVSVGNKIKKASTVILNARTNDKY